MSAVHWRSTKSKSPEKPRQVSQSPRLFRVTWVRVCACPGLTELRRGVPRCAKHALQGCVLENCGLGGDSLQERHAILYRFCLVVLDSCHAGSHLHRAKAGATARGPPSAPNAQLLFFYPYGLHHLRSPRRPEFRKSWMAERREMFGVTCLWSSSALVRGEVECLFSHASIAERSYVCPSAHMQGSRMILRVRRQMKASGADDDDDMGAAAPPPPPELGPWFRLPERGDAWPRRSSVRAPE
mmetsp:Transcript_13420/g.39027  ORF Transcript_13420/g.39027 Transcript_13420/m.39027 type:complete len:241 (-) Transcript_13420:2359-3081(-)